MPGCNKDASANNVACNFFRTGSVLLHRAVAVSVLDSRTVRRPYGTLNFIALVACGVVILVPYLNCLTCFFDERKTGLVSINFDSDFYKKKS